MSEKRNSPEYPLLQFLIHWCKAPSASELEFSSDFTCGLKLTGPGKLTALKVRIQGSSPLPQ
jgi:hypothetical protein